jgi:hypothetical protein
MKLQFAPKIKKQYQIILCLISIIFIWFFYFKKYLFGITYFPYDSKDQFLLWSQFLVDSLKTGEIPLWNPNQFLGEDFIGNPQTLFFSPLFLLLIIVNLILDQFGFGSVDFIQLIHVVFSAIGLFLFLNISGISKKGSLIAAFIFMLAGPLASRLQHTPQIVAFSYIPWCLLSSYYLIKYKKISSLLFFIVFNSALIVHFNQVSYIGILLIIFYVKYLIFSDKNNYQKLDNIKYYLISALISLVSIFCLVFIPLILVLNNILNSSRTDYSYEYASSNIIYPLSYLTFLSPNGLFSFISEEFSGIGDISEQYLYIGHLPIVIISLMFFKIIKNAHCKFWLCASLFFLLGTLGGKTIFYKVLFDFLPGFSLFRRPTDFSYFLIFSFCIIVAFAFDSLIYALINKKNEINISLVIKALLFITVILLLFPIIYTKYTKIDLYLSLKDIIIDYFRIIMIFLIILGFSRVTRKKIKYLQILLCLYLVLDLSFNNCYKEFNSSTWWLNHFKSYNYNYGTLIKEELNSELIPYRLMMIGSNRFEDNFPSAMDFQSVNGYNPIESDRYHYLKSILFDKFNQSFLDISGIKLISVSKSNNYKNLKDDVYPKVFDDEYFEFRKNTTALKRLFIADSFVYDSDPERKLTEIVNSETTYSNDFSKVAVIEDQSLLELSKKYDDKTGTYYLNSKDRKCESKILNTTYKNNYVKVKLSNSCNSLLILTDNYFPGWYAFVDGIEHKIYRTNYFFRSVYIESGNHEIEFKYLPLKSGIKLLKK